MIANPESIYQFSRYGALNQQNNVTSNIVYIAMKHTAQ